VLGFREGGREKEKDFPLRTRTVSKPNNLIVSNSRREEKGHIKHPIQFRWANLKKEEGKERLDGSSPQPPSLSLR